MAFRFEDENEDDIGLAVVLSIWLGLFWLVAIVGVHLVFEWIRQAHPEACGARLAARNRKAAGHGCCATAAGAAALGVPNQTPWAGPWSLGDRLTIGFGCCCVLSILLAPLLTEHNWTSVWQSVIAELRPFPG